VAGVYSDRDRPPGRIELDEHQTGNSDTDRLAPSRGCCGVARAGRTPFDWLVGRVGSLRLGVEFNRLGDRLSHRRSSLPRELRRRAGPR
jgi:hypothetical protein